ncbi:MAG: response regulator [Oligoflexales bacterium]
MAVSIKDRSASIIVIESFSAIRQTITDQLKSLGFKNINGVSNTKDAIGILEVEKVDWIICSSNLESPENNIQLLSLISSRMVLKHIRMTMFLEEEELGLVPILYEKGLLSHIMKPLNKTVIEEGLNKFVEHFEKNAWNDVKLSAHNLRSYLDEKKKYRSLIHLERGLLSLYPGECEYLLNLANPLFKEGETDSAKNVLKQVLMIDSGMAEQAEELAKSLFGQDFDLKKENEQSENVNILGVEHCLIIDSDDAARKEIRDVFEDFGVTKISEYDNGDDAWVSLNANSEPSLIIQEWRIPKVSGPIMIQRIRGKFPSVPIVILSSLVSDDDKPLIQEMGVETVHEKPLQRDVFKKSLIYLVQQERLPANASVLERKIRQFLKSGKIKEAMAIKDQFVNNSEIPEVHKKSINAEFCYHNGNYVEARNLAIEAIKSDPNSIYLLNFIGKCLMQLEDHKAAVMCFKKAQVLSPKNIERLCDIAKASYEAGDTETCEKALAQGKAIDRENEGLKVTEAPIRIDLGPQSDAKDILAEMESIQELVSYMNNKAVALTKSGMIKEGIELYHKTIASMPDNKKDTKFLVMYNLGLALAKHGDLKGAKAQLESILSESPKKIERKCHSLKLRIEKSLDTGSKLEFITAEKKEAPSADGGKTAAKEGEIEDSVAVIGYIQSNPGEICCYKVFINPEEIDDKWKSIKDQIPHFKPRKAIEREEAAGLEKVMRAG